MHKLIQQKTIFYFENTNLIIQQFSKKIPVYVEYDGTFDGYIMVWRYSFNADMEGSFLIDYNHEEKIMHLSYLMFSDYAKHKYVYVQGRAVRGGEELHTNVIEIRNAESLPQKQVIDPENENDIDAVKGIIKQIYTIEIKPEINEIENNIKQYRDDAQSSADQAKTTLNKVIETADQKVNEIVSTATNATQGACAAIEVYKNNKKVEFQASVDTWKGEISVQGNKIIQEENTILADVSTISETVSKNAETVKTSIQQAKTYRDDAGIHASNANLSAQEASASADSASTSKTDAETAENNAKASETTATQQATYASASEEKASEYWNNAKAESYNASQSASKAKTSETNAKTYETSTKQYADAVKSSTDKIASNEVTANQALLDASTAQLTADAGIVIGENNRELIEIVDSNIDKLKQKNLEHAKLADVDGRIITIADVDGSFLVDYKSFGETKQVSNQLLDLEEIMEDSILNGYGIPIRASIYGHKTHVTDFIKLDDTGIVTINQNNPSNQPFDIMYYDINKNFISNKRYSVKEAPFTAPFVQGSYYVRFTIPADTYETSMINHGAIAYPFEQYGYCNPPTLDFSKTLYSKKVSEIRVDRQLLNPNKYETAIINGVNFQKNIDGSVSIHGTAIEDAVLILGNYINDLVDGENYMFDIKSLPLGSHLQIRLNDGSYTYKDNFVVEKNTMMDIKPYIKVLRGTTVNETYYPLLRCPNEEQIISLSQPIILRGLPVSTGGNVTIDGQQYVSDSIELVDGEYKRVKRLQEEIINGDNVSSCRVMDYFRGMDLLTSEFRYDKKLGFYIKGSYCISENFKKTNIWSTDIEGFDTVEETVDFTVLKSRVGITNDMSVADRQNAFYKYIKSNGVEFKFLLMLKNEIIETLPLEDQIKIKSLSTFKDTSNITDNANTHKQLRYVIDFDRYAHIKEKSFDIALIKQKEGYIASIDDSAEYYNKSMGMYGETHQNTTTGAQLFDVNKCIPANGGYIEKNLDNGKTLVIKSADNQPYSGMIIPNLNITGDVVVSYEVTGGITPIAAIHYIVDGQSFYISGNGAKGTIPDNATKVEFRVNATHSHITPNASTAIFTNLMLNKGTIPLSWESFTGGQPAPNFDYQQEMVSKIVNEIRVTGRNLFQFGVQKINSYRAEHKIEDDVLIFKPTNTSDPYWGSEIAKGIIYRPSHGYKIKVDGMSKIKISLSNKEFNKNYLSFIDENDISLGYATLWKMGDVVDLTQYQDVKFVVLRVGITLAEIKEYRTTIQIEYGDKATDYEPYKEQIISLSQPITLRGLPVSTGGNVTINGQQYISDSIEYRDGKLQHVQRIGVVDNTKWIETNVQTGTAGKRYACIIEYMRNYAPIVLCTHYTHGVASYSREGDFITSEVSPTIPNSGRILIRTLNKQFETVETFRQWMIDNNVQTYYGEKAPIYTHLPEADQQALQELQLYRPNSNITADGAWLQVEYVADQKINQDRIIKRLEALEGAVVNNV